MADIPITRLLSFARDLQRASTFEELLETTRTELLAATGYAHAWLAVADDEDALELRLIDYAGAQRGSVWDAAPVLKVDGDAMLEEIIRSDAPVVVEDARTDPRTNKQMVETLGNRTIINVPLRFLDKPFGAMGTGTFGDEGCRPPTQHELAYLVGMASQLSVAAGRIRFLEERRKAEATLRDMNRVVEKAAVRLRVLAESSHQFASTTDTRELVDLVARRLSELVGDGCGVRLVSRHGDTFDATVTATHHADPQVAAALRELAATEPLRIGEGLTGRVVLTGQPILIDKRTSGRLRAEVPPKYRAIVEKAGVDNLLAVPLAVQGRVIGVIFLARSDEANPYTIDDQRLVQDLADRAALAIDHAERTAELRRTNLALQRSEARFRRLTESGIMGIVVSDASGRFQEANDAFLSLLGYTREDVAAGLLNSKTANTSTRLQTDSQAIAELMAQGYARPWEKELLCKDGTTVPVLVGAAMIDDGSGENIAFVVDLRERKRAEAAVREAELLRREKDAVLEANRELEAFSYSVAHDLRAPLRGIHGFSDALLEDHGDKLDEEAKRLLGRVMAGAERMGQIIDALLALARLSRFEARREIVDLVPIARAIVEQLRVAEPGRAVEFVAPERIVARGDPLLLRVLLENLIGNAWKFTRQRPRAKVELGGLATEEGPLYFVRDNGAGFDMAFVDKLFAPFQRLHAPDEFEGSGVGLATVHRIVRRHGGRVWADGAVGRGATFRFTLPVEHPGREASAWPPRASAAPQTNS
jgi:PAS domain S-box-containing protein